MAHPISQALIKVLEEHKTGDEDLILQQVKGTFIVHDVINTEMLNRLRSQIDVYEKILDIKEFLSSEYEENQEHEISDSRTEDFTSGKEI